MLSPVHYYRQLWAFPSNLLQLKANSSMRIGINGLSSNGFISHGYKAEGWLFAAGCCYSAGSNPSGYNSAFSLRCESFLMDRTFNNLSHSLSLMYSLLFNQVWVHTVFSPLAMTCPDLLTSIRHFFSQNLQEQLLSLRPPPLLSNLVEIDLQVQMSLRAARQTRTKRLH